jgi:hypothetical protein
MATAVRHQCCRTLRKALQNRRSCQRCARKDRQFDTRGPQVLSQATAALDVLSGRRSLLPAPGHRMDERRADATEMRSECLRQPDR